MSKRKLTAEDKKDVLLRYFRENKEFYTLKELEAVVPRETGLAEKQIKDILQNLVDDGVVKCERLAKSMFFWSFPGQELQEKRARAAALATELSQIEEKIAKARPEERDADQKFSIQLGETENVVLKSRLVQLEVQLGECDEDQENTEHALAQKRELTKQLHEAANRWTDNIFSIKSWVKKKFNCEDAMIDKQFRIPGDFDYLE